MRTISFNEIKQEGNKTYILAKINRDGKLGKDCVLSIEFFKELDVEVEVIVICLIRMFKFWDEINVNINISSSIAKIAEKIISKTKCKLKFMKVIESDKRIQFCRGSNIILCFTGGFDSLALSLLLPINKTKLVSVDFEGLWSKREREWFNKFNTRVVKTNILKEVGYSEITFQACPSVLYANELNASYLTLGNILEMDNAQNIGKRFANSYIVPGLRELYFTYGLTEVATLKIIAKSHPELILGAFESLADNWTEKYLRKYLLVKSLEITDGISIDLPFNLNKNKFKSIKFGERYPSSLLYCYFYKFCGEDFASLYCQDVPENIKDFIKSHKLTFFNRVATNIFESMPIDFRSPFVARLSDLEIVPYLEDDWKELLSLTKLINANRNQNVHI